MNHSKIIKDFLLKSGTLHLARRLDKGSTAAILRYHAIVYPEDNFYASPSICLSPDRFEEQIRYFSSKWQIVSLDVIADAMEAGRPFPEHAVALTFDDGYQDNYHAHQILRRYGATGTFYVAAGCIDNVEPLWLFEVIYLIRQTARQTIRISIKGSEFDFTLDRPERRLAAIRRITEMIKSNDLATREAVREQLREQLADVADIDEKARQVMMTWKQVREMVKNGMDIGGHTMTHLNLPNAEIADAVGEITECRRTIELKIGKAVRHFSYPNGGGYAYYNSEILQAVKQAGFTTSTTSTNGVVRRFSPLLELPRIRITDNLSDIVYQMSIEPVVQRIKGST